MNPIVGRNSFLDRLRAIALPSDVVPVERVLASARAFLAVASLFAIWLDPTEPSRFATLTYILLAAYVAYTLLVFAYLRGKKEVTARFSLGVHAVDVFWPTLISFFTTGPNSPFYIFYVFVLLEAAYRWGFLETLQTAEAAVALFLLQGVVMAGGPKVLRESLGMEFELNRFIVRAVYLLIIGYLLGYLGEEERGLRVEESAIARLVGKVQSQIGVRGAMHIGLEEILHLTSAQHAMVPIQNTNTGQAFLWSAQQQDEKSPVVLASRELGAEEQQAYLLSPPGAALYARWPEPASRQKVSEVILLDEDGRRLREVAWVPPETFLPSTRLLSILTVRVRLGNDYVGQLLILDPQMGAAPERVGRFLLKLGRQAAPAIYSVFLLRRLRSRAGAVERARVARELHDGVIQSLIGLEMQIDVLRRKADGSSHALGQELAHLENLLRQEVLNLRELMQHMKPLDLGPKQLLDFLADTVDRFRRDTGIAANFVCSLAEVSIPPRVCNELARILQEALVNVRKHSGARSVLVRFDTQDGFWRLVIDDDGQGFDFRGRQTLTDLDASRKGPMVIKERVRAFGGELVVESLPGQGSRLEIRCPQKMHG